MIEIGSGAGFPDIPFILEMKEYRKMSRAELLAWIEKFKSKQATRTKAQQQRAAAALRDSEERLRAILETAVEGIITIDERGIIESFNPAAEKIFGCRAREVIGKNVSLLMPSPHREQHDAYIGNYLRTGRAKIIGIGRETVGRRKDGAIFPMDLSVSEVRLADRRLFTGFVRDITGRKQAEKALLHYAALVESSDDAIVGKTLEGYITSWNKGAETIYGYTRKEMIGKHISILIPADRKDEEPEILEKINRGESVDHYETIRQRKDGRLIDISVTISPIRDADGKIIGASKVARDITERKRLEREILEISDREQRRIGHDLHDGLCQHLAGIELMSQVLEQKLTPRSKDAAKRAGDIAKNVREAIGQTRSLARGLSPVTLESEGLASALHELAVNTEKLFNVECRFDADSDVLGAQPRRGHASFPAGAGSRVQRHQARQGQADFHSSQGRSRTPLSGRERQRPGHAGGNPEPQRHGPAHHAIPRRNDRGHPDHRTECRRWHQRHLLGPEQFGSGQNGTWTCSMK